MKNENGEHQPETEEKIRKPKSKKEADKRTIENHRQAAAHNQAAAKHHLDAAKYHESGNKKKAAQSTVLAYGHHAIAGEFLTDDAKHHAQTLKHTIYRS